MDMSEYAEAMRDVATYIVAEVGRPEFVEGDVADKMNADGRFADLDEAGFIDVRDEIGNMVQSAVVTLTWPDAA